MTIVPSNRHLDETRSVHVEDGDERTPNRFSRTGGSAEPEKTSSRPLLWPVLMVRYYDLRTVNSDDLAGYFAQEVRPMASPQAHP
uniref:Uncharacterized protein n=1 Tax=Oryza sativa subsp. japonica TaxID=39947 RepID=Q69LF2_ORYSJ|nr:hypothetical protein [Oryza sativa Japonica Group]BAD34073.1 hypothetical protein [Oryza sativa Japonica Group]